MDDLKVHPAADIFPLLDGPAYEAFREDIGECGQQEPIAIWQGQVLDGRNRLRACKELGIDPIIKQVHPEVDPVRYVVSANLHRRHLTESQRSMVAGRLETLKHGCHANLHDIRRSEAAELLNVSERSVASASKVIGNGISSLVKLVDDGEVSVSAAATVASLPHPDQEEVVAKGPEAVKEKAKEIREAIPPMPTEEREQEVREEKQEQLGERWCRVIHDVYVAINSVRDAGGIERLARRWGKEGSANVLSELVRIREKLNGWIDHLEGDEHG